MVITIKGAGLPFHILAVIVLMLMGSCSDHKTVTDVDGHVYGVVKIGKQVWMAENLRVRRYRNGDIIDHVPNDSGWAKTRGGAFCSYGNKEENTGQYGNLYNGYAVHDGRNIAPAGWHVPTAAEIATLIQHLGGDTVGGGTMKTRGITDWLYPNTGATNASGLAALPGGYRYGPDGTFHTLGSNGYWWCTTGSFELYTWSKRFYTGFADINRDKQYLTYGFSIRCIKDQ